MFSLYSVSLGCPKNRVDAERTLGALTGKLPFTVVDAPQDADLVFINTCGFIAPAVEESVRVMMEAVHAVSTLPDEQRPVLAIAGCLIGRYGAATLAPDLPEVDLLLDASDVDNWPRRIADALAAKGKFSTPFAQSPGYSRLLSTGPSYAWLKISDGCRHNCSFCTIPAIRGPLQSTPAPLLADEARRLLERGVKELVLVAQDVSAWGQERHSRAAKGEARGLISLLEALLPLPGLERLRLMYLYPAGLTDELLRFLQSAKEPFVPYFDVPLQHAAHGVLSRMGRPFAGKPREAVERIRSFFPEAALRTSIITGFPGETEADFKELVDFVCETRFHHLGVFSYYAEEGTPAAAMEGQIAEEVKEERKNILMALQKEISEDILESYVGQRLPVLVDAPHDEWPGLHTGRVWFQAPEVDGVTYISGPGVKPGALVTAEITESSSYDLVALTDAGADAEA